MRFILVAGSRSVWAAFRLKFIKVDRNITSDEQWKNLIKLRNCVADRTRLSEIVIQTQMQNKEKELKVDDAEVVNELSWAGVLGNDGCGLEW